MVTLNGRISQEWHKDLTSSKRSKQRNNERERLIERRQLKEIQAIFLTVFKA